MQSRGRATLRHEWAVLWIPRRHRKLVWNSSWAVFHLVSEDTGGPYPNPYFIYLPIPQWCWSITRLPWCESPCCIVAFAMNMVTTTLEFSLCFPSSRVVILARPYINNNNLFTKLLKPPVLSLWRDVMNNFIDKMRDFSCSTFPQLFIY